MSMESSSTAVESPFREIDRAVQLATEVVDAPAVELTDYEDAMFVLRSTAFAPIRPESGHGGQWHTLLVRDSVVDLYGKDHFERRRLLSGLFKKAALVRDFEHRHLIPAIERLREQHNVESVAAAPLELVSTLRRVMVELMSRLIGLDDVTGEALPPFEEILQRVERGARSKFVSNPAAVVRDALEAQAELMSEHFEPAWNKRVALLQAIDQGRLPADAEPRDVLTLMVRNREQYDAFGKDAAFRELSLLLTASVGSTTNAVVFAIWDLHAWLSAHPEDVHRRTDLDFLRRCFAESLRLRQINQLLRTAIEDVVLPSGVSVPEGGVVLINRPAVNASLVSRGSSQVGDAEFDPDRVLPGKTAQYGLAFGGGAHMCIGKTLAIGDFSGGPDDDVLGIGIRLFAALEQLGVKPAPSHSPDLAPEMTGRPTWTTFPVVLERA